MSCCIKYHDIAVQYDEKYNFLMLLVVLYYLKYLIILNDLQIPLTLYILLSLIKGINNLSKQYIAF
jgi:hypothetical protein